jgi:hypothetical protein
MPESDVPVEAAVVPEEATTAALPIEDDPIDPAVDEATAPEAIEEDETVEDADGALDDEEDLDKEETAP